MRLNDATRRALRTFLQAFVGVFALSLLGWLTGVQEWASCVKDCVFPDPTILGKAAVSGVVAGAITLITYAQNLLEDKGVIPAFAKATASSGENPVGPSGPAE